MTTTRVALPSGQWVELRDPATLLRGDKKRALKMVAFDDEGAFTLGTQMDMSDGVIAIMVNAWSFNLPLPATAEVLDLLPIADGVALEELPAIVEAHKLLFPQEPEKTEVQVADPESPTVPSAD
ncbi:hypothetical protein ABTZ78_17490 [Streptomyces bauhiniae]|uniref:hypothetical protein n=1 Tax=Streptomyces bauhiniae TaxID=2340725 RepID=UPI00331CF3CB